jgi:hypothetical protein
MQKIMGSDREFNIGAIIHICADSRVRVPIPVECKSGTDLWRDEDVGSATGGQRSG